MSQSWSRWWSVVSGGGLFVAFCCKYSNNTLYKQMCRKLLDNTIGKRKLHDQFQKVKPFFIGCNVTYSHESKSQTEQNTGKQKRKQIANTKAACSQPIRRGHEPQRYKGRERWRNMKGKKSKLNIFFYFF